MSRALKVTKTKPTQSAAELAAAIVQDHFDWMLTTPQVFTQGSVYETRLTERAFDEVKAVVLREYIDDHGTPEPGDDLVDEFCAQEAGYLIGVQVGLRLRRAGA